MVNPCTDNTQYMVSVSRSKEVPVFGPPVPPGATFAKGKHFADFILAKVINAENAAHRSEKFATMATRTRQEYLKDLATNYSSTTVVETGQKFCKYFFFCYYYESNFLKYLFMLSVPRHLNCIYVYNNKRIFE